MKAKYAALLLILLPFFSTAQNNFLNKVKNKVNARIDKNVNQAIDKSLDKTEDGVKAAGNGQSNSTTPVNRNSQGVYSTPVAGVGVYSKYDFVPGEQVIYGNDFATDSPGELPTGWNSNGNGAVVSLNTQQGKWVQLFQNSTYLTDNTASFTENFTVEFDLVIRRENPKAAFPQFAFGVLASGDLPNNSNELLKSYTKTFATELKIQPYDNKGSHMHLETFEKTGRYLNTDIKKFSNLEQYFNKPIHIAMQFQKERMRIWFNEEKMYDLPKAITAGTDLNQLYFVVKRYGGEDSEVGYAIGNIKIAKGIPDTRHKLVDEGKFSTTGILFDVNSSTIKPESNGVLKEIASVLKEHSNINVLIVGHTDSDGGDKENLELSRKRAEAVRQALVTDYGIDEKRMKPEGKGESQPVADNKRKEGKSANRRVEFIKL